MNFSVSPVVSRFLLQGALMGMLVAVHGAAHAQAAQADCLLRPREDSRLASPVKVVVRKKLVDIGDTVKAGALLIELDSSTVDARLQRMRVEKEFNERALARSLQVGNLLSEKERDELQTAVARNTAEIVELEAELSRHRIVAPHDGVVTDIRVSVGEINKDDFVLQLAKVSELRAELNLPADQRGRYRPGASMSLTAENGITRRGKVTFVDPLIDPASQTFRLHVVVPNADGKWTSGMQCRR